VREKSLGQGLCQVTVVTVENASVTIIETVTDGETKRAATDTKIYTLTATKPTSTTDSAGRKWEVTRLQHNLYLEAKRALDPSVIATSRMDALWGLVIEYRYITTVGATLPDRATSFSGRWVLDTDYRELSNGESEVLVTTVASAAVSQTDNPVDPKTGDAFSRTRTWTLATSAPAASALSTDGRATTVTQEAHNLWLSVNQPVNVRVGIANKRTYTVYHAMVWPAVLTDFDVRNLTEYQAGSGYQRYTVATYGQAPSYAGPVRVVVDEWWQKTAPTDGELTGKSTPFQPTGIHINGLRTPPAISPCLHEEVVFTAQVYDETQTAYSTYEVRIAATEGHTTWPATYIDYEVEPDSGGYTVRKLTWHRPFVPESSVTSTVITA
jgi:hypothetical protein